MCYRDLRNNGEHLSSNDSDIRRLYRERVEEPKEQKKREQREAGRLERLYWEGVAKEKEQERQKEQERREGEERYRRFCERVEKLEEMKKREENERVRLYREKVEEFKEQEENGVVAEGYGDGDGDSDGDGEETQSAREEGKAVVEDMYVFPQPWSYGEITNHALGSRCVLRMVLKRMVLKTMLLKTMLLKTMLLKKMLLKTMVVQRTVANLLMGSGPKSSQRRTGILSAVVVTVQMSEHVHICNSIKTLRMRMVRR